MHPEEQHLPFIQTETTTIFSFGYQSCICLVLIHSVDKTHVLVVTEELIWLLYLNILSFNFVPTWKKSLTWTIFRRSYVNCLAFVLTNHTSYAAFCFMCAVLLKVATFLFLQLFVPSDSTFA